MLDLGDIQRGAIGKAEFLQPKITRRIASEVVAHRDLVGTVLEFQDQVTTGARQLKVTHRDIGAKLDGIDLGGTGVKVVDCVLAPATLEAVHIAADIAFQGIIASTTGQGVVAIATIASVVACPTDQHVVACPRIQDVVALFGLNQIITGATIDHVAQGTPKQIVIT
ncbi:hypothetical protein D9M68_754580 [compost metagenome]